MALLLIGQLFVTSMTLHRIPTLLSMHIINKSYFIIMFCRCHIYNIGCLYVNTEIRLASLSLEPVSTVNVLPRSEVKPCF